MNSAENEAGSIKELCRLGKLKNLTEEYVSACYGNKADNGSNSKKAPPTLPNLAGFCRYVGIGIDELERQLSDFPQEKERLFAVLEDEALNSSASPTVVSAYLKKRLGYEKEAHSVCDTPAQLKIQFEHDIFKDGE